MKRLVTGTLLILAAVPASFVFTAQALASTLYRLLSRHPIPYHSKPC
jgi:hypothetical protein